MKIKYHLGEHPTAEEWDVHQKVERYSIAQNVECWLDDNELEISQEKFDEICNGIDMGDLDEEMCMLIERAYDNLIRR